MYCMLHVLYIVLCYMYKLNSSESFHMMYCMWVYVHMQCSVLKSTPCTYVLWSMDCVLFHSIMRVWEGEDVWEGRGVGGGGGGGMCC